MLSSGPPVVQVEGAVGSHPDRRAMLVQPSRFLNAFSLEQDMLDVLVAASGPDGLPFDTRSATARRSVNRWCTRSMRPT